MKRKEFNDLGHGLYIIHWKDGRRSEAAIGSDDKGNLWIAATNWLGSGPAAPHIRDIKTMVRVEAK